jgi:hypothetical protein
MKVNRADMGHRRRHAIQSVKYTEKPAPVPDGTPGMLLQDRNPL